MLRTPRWINEPMIKKVFIDQFFTSLLLISSAVHADTFRLQFHDQIMGGHQTVDLQNALREQYQVDANQLTIEKVDVVIKSMAGGGQIWFGSRYNQADRRFVAGQAGNFQNPANWTFRKIAFPVQQPDSDLQLNLNGEFKLREVIVSSADFAQPEKLQYRDQSAADILLPLYNMDLHGLSSLDLKQLLLNDTQLDPDEYHLKSVTVAVKSRQDGAQVWLECGQRVSKVEIISATEKVFGSHDPGTYQYRNINAAEYENESSPWLLKFSGDIRLYEVAVSLNQR